MTADASNNDGATTADDAHRDKRRKTDSKKTDCASNNNNDAATQTQEKTHKTTDVLDQQQGEVPRPFAKTPAELRLLIAYQVMHQYCSVIIVKSSSGERLIGIWRKAYWFTAANDRAATDRRTQRQVLRMTNASHNIFDARYVYSRQVPALLQVGHFLREEGREAFLKVARAGLAHAETHNNFDRQYCTTLSVDYTFTELRNVYEKLQGGPITASDELIRELWLRMQRQGVEMVCNALRWHALRHLCKLMELEP